VSGGAKYGRTEGEWQELEQAGWDFLKAKAAERRGDAARDPTVSTATRTWNWLPGRASPLLTSTSKLTERRWATCWAGSLATAAGPSPGC
jgi:hypothetical protein